MKTFSFRVDPLTNEEYWEVYPRGQQYEYIVAQAQWLPRYAPYRPGRI